MEAETFTIKDMYKTFRGELSKVPWRRMICNNQGSPKWTFILYLAIQRRFVATVIWQRLLQWLSITKSSAGWNEEIEWETMHANMKSIQDSSV
ncbi:hypothetical protein H5410_014977 [Solanum commersonii]|uniref:Uncharacterized protein n=1 Tax=Solanum commersonii TaxID=4109 RepID=A0A9J5ZSG7_SOLCO|nr:hypothetical protein H5410_014977 [Solanum commersonii]